MDAGIRNKDAKTTPRKTGVVACRYLYPRDFFLGGQELPFLLNQTRISWIVLEHYSRCEYVKYDICQFTNEVELCCTSQKILNQIPGFLLHMNNLLHSKSVL